MFISEKYKLVFLEVPRTGSISITDALTRFDPESPTVIERRNKGHMFDYHRFWIPDTQEYSYTIVATHRNPYDRIWSFWKHRHNTGNPEIFRSVSWKRYVQWACDPLSVPEVQQAILDVPISEMFDCDRVDFWLRFDSLATSWRELAEMRGLRLPSLSRLNESVHLGEFRDAYDAELAELVADRFAADFKRFGYEIDSWRRQDKENDVPAVAVSNKKTDSVRSKQTTSKDRKQLRSVAILTHFSRSRAAYSLNRVVQDQIAMLLKHGYQPKVLVVEAPYWSSPTERYSEAGVEILQLPNLSGPMDGKDEEQIAADIENLSEALETALKDVDVVMTHDVIYQVATKKLMMAAWRVAERHPEILWLHWIHSATSPYQLKTDAGAERVHTDLLVKKWPGSYPVYFNRMSIPRIAENFGYEEKQVKVVPHPIDVCRFLNLSPLTTRLYEEKKLHLADYITACPTRLDRGKQIEWTVKIMARLAAGGDSIRILVMDFHSTGESKDSYRKEIKTVAREWGIHADDLIFLSEFDDSLRVEAPHGMVRELFSLSHLYIQPSRSESYSLAAQEAAVMGNLLIMNADFPPMREVFGEDALYFQFSSNIDRNTLRDGDTISKFQDVEFEHEPQGIPSSLINRQDGKWVVRGEVAYADMIAKRIRYEFLYNPVLAQRQRRMRDRNLFSVFTRYLEPLLYLDSGQP